MWDEKRAKTDLRTAEKRGRLSATRCPASNGHGNLSMQPFSSLRVEPVGPKSAMIRLLALVLALPFLWFLVSGAIGVINRDSERMGAIDRYSRILTRARAPRPVSSAAETESLFQDVTKRQGIDFRHVQGAVLWYLPQVTGSGVAMFDADGDGRQDLFFVQGSGDEDVPDSGQVRRVGDSGKTHSLHCELYLSRHDRFEPSATAAGVDASGFGMAVLAWDYDNDGYTDLAITRYNQPILLCKNNGDGTFSEVAARSNLVDPRASWETSLTALDADGDGFPDLFVGQYLKFEKKDWIDEPKIRRTGLAPGPETLLPGLYAPLSSRLMRNRGDGSFLDVTDAVGLASAEGQTLGALAMDLDGDGRQDLMVANDGQTPNRVYWNDRGRRFVDVTRESMAGEVRGSMGFAVGELDESGALGILVTHWRNPPALYRSIGTGSGSRRVRYRDDAARAGLATADSLVGWAAAFLDADGDGLEDILQIHGGANPPPDDPSAGRLEFQPTLLYLNQGKGRFRVVNPRSEDDPLFRRRVGRGAAFGDIDRDGMVDVALSNNNGPAELWRGRSGSGNGSWIGLVPVGTMSNRDAIGLKVSIHQSGRRRLKEVTCGQSYFSSGSRELLFGLGQDESPVTVQARWPSGRTEEYPDLRTRKYHRLVEGTGATSRSPATSAQRGAIGSLAHRLGMEPDDAVGTVRPSTNGGGRGGRHRSGASQLQQGASGDAPKTR